MQKFAEKTVSIATMDMILAALESRGTGYSPGKRFVEELQNTNPGVLVTAGAILDGIMKTRPDIIEDYSRGMETGMMLMSALYEIHIESQNNPAE